MHQAESLPWRSFSGVLHALIQFSRIGAQGGKIAAGAIP
jgi:hypothetical protein